MKKFAVAALSAMLAATPALAQDNDDWTGFYVGGHLGYAFQKSNNDETILFDNNLDGTFGDTVRTGNATNGPDAFGPGFCGGSTSASVPGNGCRGDEDGTDYGVHAGFDYDFGGFVVGLVGEYGETNVSDSVTAFSTTPAYYTITRELGSTYGIRARAGVDLGNTLIYGTGGAVNAKIRTRQTNSNTVNAFQGINESDREWGYRYGGGIERRFGPLALGVQYLYTRIKDDEFRVNVTRGGAPATNPFVLANANGTQFRRSDEVFNNHSVQATAAFRF